MPDMSAVTAVSHSESAGRRAMSVSTHGLLVLPHERRDGFWASIRGKAFDLADPSSEAFAPTPDDLFVVSIASELAWSGRSLLRANGVPDRVNVRATWQKPANARGLADITMVITVPKGAEEAFAALDAAFEDSLAGRAQAEPAVHIAFE
jgi:hypothetical protein